MTEVVTRRAAMPLLVCALIWSHTVVAQQLSGNIGSSAKWGSSWIDLGQATSFLSGQVLKITLQDDSARSVLVRLLPVGASPDEPAGLVGTQGLPVAKRVVIVPLSKDYPNIKQISVHGGEKAWDYNLGSGNGPARILTVELVPANRQ